MNLPEVAFIEATIDVKSAAIDTVRGCPVQDRLLTIKKDELQRMCELEPTGDPNQFEEDGSTRSPIVGSNEAEIEPLGIVVASYQDRAWFGSGPLDTDICHFDFANRRVGDEPVQSRLHSRRLKFLDDIVPSSL